MEKQFADKDMDVERFVAVNGQEVYGKKDRAGSKGCRDTHLKLWGRITPREIYVVFEDDVTIVENKFLAYVEELTAIDPNWVMLNFKNAPATFKGRRVSDNFGKAGRVDAMRGGKGVNAGTWAYAVNGKNIKSLLGVFEKKKLWTIDYQLRGSFDKVDCYYCLGPEQLVRHGANPEIGDSIRMVLDRI